MDRAHAGLGSADPEAQVEYELFQTNPIEDVLNSMRVFADKTATVGTVFRKLLVQELGLDASATAGVILDALFKKMAMLKQTLGVPVIRFVAEFGDYVNIRLDDRARDTFYKGEILGVHLSWTRENSKEFVALMTRVALYSPVSPEETAAADAVVQAFKRAKTENLTEDQAALKLQRYLRNKYFCEKDADGAIIDPLMLEPISPANLFKLVQNGKVFCFDKVSLTAYFTLSGQFINPLTRIPLTFVQRRRIGEDMTIAMSQEVRDALNHG